MFASTPFDLGGKSALVIGAGKIAGAIAALFGVAGASVAQVAEPDLSEAGVEALFQGRAETDILVNGATRTGAWTLDTLSMAEWDRVQEVNLRGAYLMMRAAVRAMREHGRGGRIINLSTIGSVHPVLHGNFAYGASRAGLNALTRQFALDFASDNILTNAILVGTIPSDPFPPDMPPPSGPGVVRGRLPGGLGTPDDIAPLALLLASVGGRYINGQAITVDGGFSVS